MSTCVYGIKNCDTVKKTQRWLDNHKISYDFCDFRDQLPTPNVIRNWIDRVGLDTLVNRRSTTYRKLPAELQQSTDKEVWATAIEQQPTLIKRPLLEHDGQFYCGFKEEQYKELFNV